MKKTDGIEKVNKICKSVLVLTDEDLKAVETMAAEQASYTHPLKGAKQTKINNLGSHNLKVFEAIRNLRQILIDGTKPAS